MQPVAGDDTVEVMEFFTDAVDIVEVEVIVAVVVVTVVVGQNADIVAVAVVVGQNGRNKESSISIPVPRK